MAMRNRRTRNRVRAHNNAVKKEETIAGMNHAGRMKPVEITVGHLDNVSRQDAREYAKEHDSEIKAELDQMAVVERGGDGIGRVIVEGGEIVDWKLNAPYREGH